MILSNQKLIKWLITLFVLKMVLSALETVLWVMRGVYRELDFSLYKAIRVSDSFLQLFTLASIVLVIILFYRLNENVSKIDKTKVSSKIWIIIHRIIPVFNVIYSAYFLKNYLNTVDKGASSKRNLIFGLLNAIMAVGISTFAAYVFLGSNPRTVTGDAEISKMMIFNSILIFLTMIGCILNVFVLRYLQQIDARLFEKENPFYLESDFLDR